MSIGSKAILFHCFAGCPNAEVLAALARIGVKSSDLFDGDGHEPEPMPRADAANRNARRLWREAFPASGTLAEAYLALRGIAVRSRELRYHPRTPLGPKGTARFLPAMLAAICNDERILAVHRTFIDPGSARIASFFKPKRALGSLGSGAVRRAAPHGGRLGLAEGLESALSAMQIFGIPCWATLGNERFGLVTIPESVTELHLFIDADAGGELAEHRAREAYGRDDRAILTHVPDSDGADHLAASWAERHKVQQVTFSLDMRQSCRIQAQRADAFARSALRGRIPRKRRARAPRDRSQVAQDHRRRPPWTARHLSEGARPREFLIRTSGAVALWRPRKLRASEIILNS